MDKSPSEVLFDAVKNWRCPDCGENPCAGSVMNHARGCKRGPNTGRSPAPHPQAAAIARAQLALKDAAAALDSIAAELKPEEIRKAQALVRIAAGVSLARGELEEVSTEAWPATELTRIGGAFAHLAKTSAEQAQAQINAWERRPILTVHENEALDLFRKGRDAFASAMRTFAEVKRRCRLVVIK